MIFILIHTMNTPDNWADAISVGWDKTISSDSLKLPLDNSDEQRKRSAEMNTIEWIYQKLQENKPVPAEWSTGKIVEEYFIIDWEKVTVRFVPKDEIAPAFGYCYGDGRISVRNDLPLVVQRFVKSHELYHQWDHAVWGWWIGREIRANIIPGIKDPVWLLTTIWYTISSKERINLYIDRFKRKY